MALYTFSLDRFHISRPRSKFKDTDTVTLFLKVNDYVFPLQCKAMGDVSNGDHEVGLKYENVEVGPTDRVVLSYIIVNSGYPGSHEKDVQSVLDILSDASEKVASAVYPLGPVWPIVNRIVHELNKLLFANCDGTVAADTIPGPIPIDAIPANILTGADLQNLTSGNDIYTDGRYYPGTDSAVGCGANSRYYVFWSTRRIHHFPPA